MTTPQTTKALAPVDELKNSLAKMEPQFKMALPAHIPPAKFLRVLQTAVSTNPVLVQANRPSLYAACMRSAQDGLIPDGREAALVTFNSKNGPMVQFMPMVAGILKKIRNSGELASITAQVVHANDRFRYWVDGDGEHIEHEPLMFGERGDIQGVYALAKTKDGAVYIEVMTEAQVQDIRNVSRAKDSGPWAGAFADEMRKKSAIRRLSKRLPMSTDLESVIHADDDLYDFKPQEEKPVTEASTKPERLGKIIEAKAEQVPAESVADPVIEGNDEEIPL